MENWTSTPWSLTGGATSFSGTQTDSLYNGGTSATFTFSSPQNNVDISAPASPDNSSASTSSFGVEPSGFGVAESNVGRFDRQECFVLQADHAFQLNSISWAEYSGDEKVHLSWTSAGVQMSEVFEMEAGSFYTTTTFEDIAIDPNTAVTFTNVSDSSAHASGRLRIKQINVELIDAMTLPEIGDTHRLESWGSSPWNLVTGDTGFTGSINDTVHGSVSIDFLDPLSGIDVTDPNLPDYSTATVSLFGLESSGFGIGETNVGRFDRGESFSLQAAQAFELQTIRWAEYSGDETIQLTWTSSGIPMSSTISMDAGSFYTETEFIGIYPDANTPLEITNVSSSSAYASGRLRVNYIELAFQNEAIEATTSIGAYMFLNQWQYWPWNGVSGDYTLSGTQIAAENGGTEIEFTITAQSGVDVSDPEAPDFASASAAVFGFETTGFGVGETYAGRFDREESITLISDHDYQIDAILWREVTGDEQIHLSWTSDGVTYVEVLDILESSSEFENFTVDANTPLVITNVSSASAYASGRLRFNEILTKPLYDSSPSYDHSGSDGFQQMTGVNLAGGAFDGWALYQTDPLEWDYYHSKGLDLIRLDFKWERIQPTLYGTVDFTDLDAEVALANARGMKVVLDMHNYARYNNELIGSSNVPNSAFADVWQKIADHYKNESAIYGYGIMNEPHGTGGLWPAAAQAATDSIRLVDTSNWVIVSGENWSKASTWRTSNPTLDITDAYGKVMYEAHLYFDSGTDGVYNSYDSENPTALVGARNLHPFILWLQEKGARGFIGEYGIPKDDIRWNPILDNFMSHMYRYGLSGTYWAAGKNWNNYDLDCSPTNDYATDAIQMEILEKYVD
jgi:hypothetical protein